jgi:hypothetical protein
VRRAVGSVDDAKDVAFLHDEQLLVVDLDLGSRPLPEEDAVAGLDVEGGELAVLVAPARADGRSLCLPEASPLRYRGFDAAFGLLFALEAFDHDPVMQGTECHVVSFLFWAAGFAEQDGSGGKGNKREGPVGTR